MEGFIRFRVSGLRFRDWGLICWPHTFCHLTAHLVALYPKKMGIEASFSLVDPKPLAVLKKVEYQKKL